jgi:predicted RNA-binding Zn-ribbon protein involved in translation (DUF1610 family)
MSTVTPLLNSHCGPADAVMIARFYVPIQAEFCRQLLESRDIPVWLGDENTFSIHNWYTAAGFFVRPEDIPEAMKILRDLWDNEGSPKETSNGEDAEETETAEPPEICPNCGGTNVSRLHHDSRPFWLRFLRGAWLLFTIAFMLILPKPHRAPNRHCPDCDWEW